MTHFFPSDLAALCYDITAMIWIVSEIAGCWIIPSLRRRGTKIERKDNGSGFIIIGSIFLSIGIAFAFSAFSIAMLPGWVSYAGVFLMLAGIVIRQWSMAVLGRYFSASVGIQEGQRVVNRGPYRFVRHPSYTGALVIMAGVGLALQSWGAVLVSLIIFGLAFGNRIRLEEKVLVSLFGDEYVQYMKKTKRLIPFVI